MCSVYVLCVFVHAVCQENMFCVPRAILVPSSLKTELKTARINSSNSNSYFSKSETHVPETFLLAVEDVMVILWFSEVEKFFPYQEYVIGSC